VININTGIDNQALERIHTILSTVPNGVEKGFKSIITSARTEVRKEVLEQITKIYHIPKSQLRNRNNTTVKVSTENTDSGIIGTIKYSGYRIPLYRFNVSPKQPSKESGKGKQRINLGDGWIHVKPSAPVYAATLRGESRKHIKNTFIARMSNGHTGIFERKGKDRFPIREVMSHSTPRMAERAVKSDEVEKVVKREMNDKIEDIITKILYGGRNKK
jgi:hypothetical protein